MSDLRKRFDSLLIVSAMSGGSKAANLHDKTTGSPQKSQEPPGAFQKQELGRVEEILTGSLKAAEGLLGVFWKDGRHIARKVKKFDEREWAIHVLTRYQNVRTGLAAAEEDVPDYVIRDLRYLHGRDGKGNPNPKRKCKNSSCSVCAAVEELTDVGAIES